MTEEDRSKITAVIPAFNEEKTIAEVVEGVKKYAAEVLVVDDGSMDRTARFALESGAKVIRIPNNSGKGNALSIGLTTAALNGSRVVVCLDSDGQHDPDDIPRIVEPIINGKADMVIGSRFIDGESRDTIPKYRRFGQGILTMATNLGNHVKITDSQSGYRAFNKEIIEGFDYSEWGMGIESEMIRNAIKSGARIQEVPIVARYEGLETSTLAPGNHGMTVLRSIIHSVKSEHPLLYFGVSGMVMTIVGVIVGLYSVQRYIESSALPFGPALLAVMMTIMGLLFILVGLILNAISEMVSMTAPRRFGDRRRNSDRLH